ncbi:MAG: hypothetical protein E7262_08280 [Lachnospiraceae bacterium]|nr:hypothetical protein [Lachnospiraceae bacterium]
MLVYNKLIEYVDVIRDMSHNMRVNGEMKHNISYGRSTRVFEKISYKYCRKCDRCDICWEKEVESSYKAANVLVDKGTQLGRIEISDLPRNFAIRCKNIDRLLLEANAGFEIERCNLRWIERINDLKNIMSIQLNEIASSIYELGQNYSNLIALDKDVEKGIRKILRKHGIYVKEVYYYENKHGLKEINITLRTIKKKVIKSSFIACLISNVLKEDMEVSINSRETVKNSLCEIVLVQKSLYQIKTYFKVMKKEGEILCGDNYTVLKDNCGQTVMLLSDGMGTGLQAFEESKKLIEMLESLLQAGFSKEIAVRLIHSAMYINSFENSMYATVDICLIDNYTGRCEFIKNGAAPSFIKRANKVEIIEYNSLPIGILDAKGYKQEYEESYNNQIVYENGNSNQQEYFLEEGDIVVMITDGLEENMGDYIGATSRIKDVLSGINSNNPKTIADILMEKCIEGNIVNDDVSVLIGILWKNN